MGLGLGWAEGPGVQGVGGVGEGLGVEDGAGLGRGVADGMADVTGVAVATVNDELNPYSDTVSEAISTSEPRDTSSQSTYSHTICLAPGYYTLGSTSSGKFDLSIDLGSDALVSDQTMNLDDQSAFHVAGTCGTANVDAPGCRDVSIHIVTKDYGDDVGWHIPEACPGVAHQPGSLASNSALDFTVCLAPGDYTFQAVDAYGDGWDGGTFEVSLGSDVLIASDTVSEYGFSSSFTVAPVPGQKGPACGSFGVDVAGCRKVMVTIDTQDNGQNVEWHIRDSTQDPSSCFAFGVTKASLDSQSTYSHTICLAPGYYTLGSTSSGKFDLSIDLGSDALVSDQTMNLDDQSAFHVAGTCGTPNVDAPGCRDVSIHIVTKDYGDDVGWHIPEACPGVAHQPGSLASNSALDFTVCLAPGDYTFQAVDAYGDGWDGGTFEVSLGSDVLIASDTVSEYGFSSSFTVAPVPGQKGPACGSFGVDVAGCRKVMVTIDTQDNGQNVEWHIRDSTQDPSSCFAFGVTKASLDSQSTYSHTICLAPGYYTLGSTSSGKFDLSIDLGSDALVSDQTMNLDDQSAFHVAGTCGTPNVDAPGCRDVSIHIVTKDYGDDVGWHIPEACPGVAHQPGSLASNSALDFTVCLAPGDYTFQAVDAYGDGWDGGTFEVSLGSDVLIASDTVSEYGFSSSFTVAPVPGQKGPACGSFGVDVAGCRKVMVTIDTQDNGQNVEWHIRDSTQDPSSCFAFGVTKASLDSQSTYSHTICLAPGYYTLGSTSSGKFDLSIDLGSDALVSDQTMNLDDQSAFHVAGTCGTPNVDAPGCRDVSIHIVTKDYGDDVGWHIPEACPGVAHQPGSLASNSALDFTVCLAPGDYTFQAVDAYGDGWDGGTFEVSLGSDVLIASDTVSEYGFSSSFTVAPVPGQKGPACGSFGVDVAGCRKVMVTIDTQDNGQNVEWHIRDSTQDPSSCFAFGVTKASLDSQSTYSHTICLAPGYYTLGSTSSGKFDLSIDLGSDALVSDQTMNLDDQSAFHVAGTCGTANVDAPGCRDVSIHIVTKDYGDDVGWHIPEACPGVAHQPGSLASNSALDFTVCLAPGDYTFQAVDAYGDGWDGGTFEVSLGSDVLIASDTVSEYGFSSSFTVAPVPGQKGPACGSFGVDVAGCRKVMVTIDTQDNGQNVEWHIRDSTQDPSSCFAFGVTKASLDSQSTYSHTICLAPGYYTLGSTSSGKFDLSIDLGSDALVSDQTMNLDDQSAFHVAGTCGTPNVDAPGCRDVSIHIVTKDYGDDVGWHIPEACPGVAHQPGSLASNSALDFTVCLAPGDYTFQAVDAYGDGWDGGTFEVSLGSDVLIASDTVSEYGFSSSFTVAPVPGQKGPACGSFGVDVAGCRKVMVTIDTQDNGQNVEWHIRDSTQDPSSCFAFVPVVLGIDRHHDLATPCNIHPKAATCRAFLPRHGCHRER